MSSYVWLALSVFVVLLLGIIYLEVRIMSALEDLKASVAAEKTVTLSVVQLLVTLTAKLNDALANEDTEELEALAKELSANTAALAAAVTANTPETAAAVGDGATSNTASPPLADLPDGHPLKPTE